MQAKAISQIGMISASKSDSVRHLKGLHVARLVVTPVGKTVPIRIFKTTTEDIEISKGCKLEEFCPLGLIEQEVVDNNNFPVNCNAVKADNLADNIDSTLDPGLIRQFRKKRHVKQVFYEFEELFGHTISLTNIVNHKIDTGTNPPIRQRSRRMPYAFRED